ncbi:hypothetical protein HHK36_032928 [Tetracentron sinense]|uniref:F-box domain-containing protein n=1 Tax=Tetracentron sinense TaxID=13715 RepID=A0A834Y4Q5_TETSI|nr:hypothetical protein HHK36_032928 [Tetracentron sinense]
MVERDNNSNESPSSPKQPGNCSDEEERVDRISGLPDYILLEILSFMPMKDAVKTGVLSKRWEFLWASVPDLDFHYSNPDFFDPNDKPEDKFLYLVDRTLFFYEGFKIRKFRVDFNEFSGWFAPYVDTWIRFMVRKKVEELHLDLSFTEYSDLYELPPHIYNITSLKKLSLKYCNFRPHGLFSWRLLTSLSLVHIYLSDHLMQDIFSGSPSLEVLDLQECRDLTHLNITSPILKKLMVHYDDYDSTKADSVLEISAPNLQSLAILGLWGRRCRLINLHCLVHATLDFELVTDGGYSDRELDSEELDSILRELLEKLHHVRDLTIGTWCIQILSTRELEILPSPPSKRKFLKLNTYLKKWDLPGIASLLRSSPDLETLVVNRDFPNRNKVLDGENYWNSLKHSFQCLLHNLKTVKIVGFIGRDGEMDLVQFLLKHAMVLEKMVIYSERLLDLKWRKRFMPEQLLEFTQKMLSFPKASPHTIILFS